MSAAPYVRVDDAVDGTAYLVAEDGHYVAAITRGDSRNGRRVDDAEWDQTFNLVEAAPDLLAALERLLHPQGGNDDDVDAAREAIAKANGGAL